MLSIETIREAVTPLAQKYNVARVDLFGSYASGKATVQSDIDFLVEFQAKVPSIFKVMGFREELQKSLRYPIDVVTLPVKRPDQFKIDAVVNVYEQP